MEIALAWLIVGQIVTKIVDFLRNAFDKDERIPKAWWQLAAWGVGIGLAFVVCNVEGLTVRLGVAGGDGCLGVVLAGLGFGSLAGFLHELNDRLGGAPSETPKGLVPRKP